MEWKQLAKFCVCGENLSKASSRGINHGRSAICDSLLSFYKAECRMTQPLTVLLIISHIWLAYIQKTWPCTPAMIYMLLAFSEQDKLIIHSDIEDKCTRLHAHMATIFLMCMDYKHLVYSHHNKRVLCVFPLCQVWNDSHILCSPEGRSARSIDHHAPDPCVLSVSSDLHIICWQLLLPPSRLWGFNPFPAETVMHSLSLLVPRL